MSQALSGLDPMISTWALRDSPTSTMATSIRYIAPLWGQLTRHSHPTAAPFIIIIGYRINRLQR